MRVGREGPCASFRLPEIPPEIRAEIEAREVERRAREAAVRSGPVASVDDQADDRQGVADELRRVAAELAELASGD